MRVKLETRISIRDMLKSPDRDTRRLGWILFLDEYQSKIIADAKVYNKCYYTQQNAIYFLNRSISASKRRMRKKNEQ